MYSSFVLESIPLQLMNPINIYHTEFLITSLTDHEQPEVHVDFPRDIFFLIPQFTGLFDKSIQQKWRHILLIIWQYTNSVLIEILEQELI